MARLLTQPLPVQAYYIRLQLFYAVFYECRHLDMPLKPQLPPSKPCRPQNRESDYRELKLKDFLNFSSLVALIGSLRFPVILVESAPQFIVVTGERLTSSPFPTASAVFESNVARRHATEKPLKRLDGGREHIISATTMNCGADATFYGNYQRAERNW